MKSYTPGLARSWKFAGPLTAIGVVGLVATGCQSSTEPPTQVWGKISYHGEPVRGGVIVLAPNSELGVGVGDSWGMGVIGENGEYTVLSSRNNTPMTAGRYGVSFRRSTSHPHRKDTHAGAADASMGIIPEQYIDTEHPVFSIDIGDRPIQVDITLRD